MKKIVVVMAVMAFLMMSTLALAQGAAGTGKKPAKEIWCCIDGTKCEKMTKEACKDAGGKQVASCKKCTKPAPKPPKKGPTVQ